MELAAATLVFCVGVYLGMFIASCMAANKINDQIAAHESTKAKLWEAENRLMEWNLAIGDRYDRSGT